VIAGATYGAAETPICADNPVNTACCVIALAAFLRSDPGILLLRMIVLRRRAADGVDLGGAHAAEHALIGACATCDR